MKKNIQTIKKLIEEMRYILLPKHKRKLPKLFLCVLMSSIFELLGVTAVLPFVYVMIDPQTVINNRVVGPILSFLGVTNPMSILYIFGVILILLYLLKNIFLIFSTWYQEYYNTRIEKELTIKMVHSFLSRPYTFFLDNTVGELGRACGSDVVAIHKSMQTIFGLTMSLFTSSLIGGYMIISDPIIALGTLSLAVIAVLILTKILKPIMKRNAEKVIVAMRKKGDAFNQTMYGIKELYVMGRKDLFVNTYDQACEDIRIVSVKQAVLSAVPNRLIESLFITGFIIIVLIRMSTSNNVAEYVPKLATFAVGAFKVLPYISGITNKISTLVYNQPFIDNAYNNLKETDNYEYEVNKYVEKHGQNIEGQNINNIHLKERIEVKNVTWQYSRGTENVLQDASLEIKKGEAIGLIGTSGAGKTTIADVILGLLKPQSGSVYMDDIDVFTIPKIWARIVGYVPQSIFLLAASIRDNVAFGMKGLSDNDIWDSLEKAQLAEFVRTLPDGLNTYVGERGVKLSGGQRQRVAIARALANKPEFLVLDEATAALDNETEMAIIEAIESLQGQVTMLIVAHRLSTIENCDRIYRIGDGKAISVSHEEIFS